MATETPETTADITAKMRNYSNDCNDGYHTDYGVVLEDMRNFADRLDAAIARERGDCAKLREALKKCLLYIACTESVGVGTITLNDKVNLDPKKIIKSAKEALFATKKEGVAK